MACPHPCPDGRAAAERSTVRELPRTADIKKAGGFGHRLFHICQARALLVGLEEVLGTGRFGRVGVLLDELVHAGLGGGLLVHLAEADALLQVSARSTVALGELGDGVTVKEYVDTAVGSGGSDVAEQILEAKNEAIQTAKTYTDTALTITEF